MGNLNYERVEKIRKENFKYLNDNLNSNIHFSYNNSVPLVFPFYIKKGNELRSKLIKNKIFCAKYWPNVFMDKEATEFEKELVNNTICLPIDQRYGIEDMKRIINLIK